MKCDTTEILRAMRLILAPGQVTECRILDGVTASYPRPHQLYGYFDNIEKLAQSVAGVKEAVGYYFIPNSIIPACKARCYNRLKTAGKGDATADHDIEARRWLLIDCDAVRPSGVSATDAEHKAALERAMTIRAALAEIGWPDPIFGDSGNGGHLLYRVDTPVKDGGLIEKCLGALAHQHSDGVVLADTSVFNPARIWKLYGTTAGKGDSLPERPHRMAKIIEALETMQVVTQVQLEKLAAQAPVKEPAAPIRRVNGNGQTDAFKFLDDFLTRNAGRLPPMTEWEAYQGGRRRTFDVCPFNPEHVNGSAFLIQRAGGVIQAGCQHNSCAENNWHTLREMIEPKATVSTKPHGAVSGEEFLSSADTRMIPDYVPFPVGALPAVLADLVSEGSAAMGCDPAQIALPALVACSSAVGNSRCISLKSSWREPAVLWGVTVLPSGALKSPALDLALEPIRDTQQKAIAEWHGAMEEFEVRKADWEGQKKNLRGAEPTPPICARIAVSDTTYEALAVLLQSATRGLLCERDELSGWLNSFNQYKAKGGADVAHWLTMHRAGMLLVDRKTGDQKIIHCPRAFVALTGTIQPGTLRLALTPEYRESGLAARLLLAMPPVRRRQWSEKVVSERTRRRYAATLAALMAIPMGGTPLEPEPVDVPMTPDAKEKWVEFYNEHNMATQASEGGDLAAAWSKIEGYAARLALIVHLVRSASNEADPAAVDLVSMEAGITLARWFGGEAERAYAMLGGDHQTDEHAELVNLIRERGGRITQRELSRASRRYREEGAARDALCKLVEEGRGRWIELPPGREGGRPVTVFEAVTQPPRLNGGDTGDGDKTPHRDSANRGYGTVTTVTGGNGGGYVTGMEDDRDYAAGDPDQVVMEGVAGA